VVLCCVVLCCVVLCCVVLCCVRLLVLEPAAPERKARRSRKGRIVLEVSNTTTLEQLKLQIYEHMHIHPSNQAVSSQCVCRSLFAYMGNSVLEKRCPGGSA
ncbi:hypothetical protein Vafri_1528, partial [Volvox africanus]